MRPKKNIDDGSLQRTSFPPRAYPWRLSIVWVNPLRHRLQKTICGQRVIPSRGEISALHLADRGEHVQTIGRQTTAEKRQSRA